MALGVLGASLFYGDSVITPAISVLSAIEGLEVAAPALAEVVVPLAAAILAVLFVVQRWGTHRVGRPVRAGDAALVRRARRSPGCARSSRAPGHPARAVAQLRRRVRRRPARPPRSSRWARSCWPSPAPRRCTRTWATSAGRPIRRAWFVLVFPALTLNYLAQGALILRDPASPGQPVLPAAADWAQIPMVVLATAATVIASQAVISGAFSVSRQALRLGFLPHLRIRHTSAQQEGQVYVPGVNWGLFVAVLAVTLTFRVLGPAGHRLRRRGHRHLPDHHRAAPDRSRGRTGGGHCGGSCWSASSSAASS